MRTQNKILTALLLSWLAPPIVYVWLQWYEPGTGALVIFIYTGFLAYIMHHVSELRGPE